MARPCATLANWKAAELSCAWTEVHVVQATTRAPVRKRVLALFGRAGNMQARRQLVRRGRGVALALKRRRRLRALLRAAGTVGDVVDLERRHDRRLLEVQAVRLAGHARERADARAADEYR